MGTLGAKGPSLDTKGAQSKMLKAPKK